jgi:hypothetical protein
VSVKLANVSAVSTYRFSWTGRDGVRMEIEWGDGLTNPLAFRHGFPSEIRNPERFGFDPVKAKKGGRPGILHVKAFVQRFADEFDAGEAEDEAEAGEDDRDWEQAS